MRVQRRLKPFGFIRGFRAIEGSEWLTLCAVVVGVFLSCREARAQTSAIPVAGAGAGEFTVSSSANGECPAPQAVEQAVLRLIPSEHHDLLAAHAVRVELDDLDTSYRVRVFKDGTPFEKTYSDPGRDCAGRSNFAAVFAVLTVMPPELGFAALSEPSVAPKPAPPPPPIVEQPAIEPPAPPQPSLARVEVSGLAVFAPAILDAPALASFGGELRVALGRGAVSGTLSIAYLARAKFELDGVRGDVTRLPASVGLRLQHEFDSWAIAGDFALLAISERVRATSLVESRAHHLLELGLRTGLQVAPAGSARWRPFFGLFAWVSPAPSELLALPVGVVGNLPYLWLGGAAGVSLGL